MGIETEIKRNRKVARTLIRLKHSLNADKEVEEYLEQERAALRQGMVTRVDADLKELLGDL